MTPCELWHVNRLSREPWHLPLPRRIGIDSLQPLDLL
jgi:hypothetical protein